MYCLGERLSLAKGGMQSKRLLPSSLQRSHWRLLAAVIRRGCGLDEGTFSTHCILNNVCSGRVYDEDVCKPLKEVWERELRWVSHEVC